MSKNGYTRYSMRENMLKKVLIRIDYDGVTDIDKWIEQITRHEMTEVNGFFDKLESIFAKEDFTKAQVVDAIKQFLPNFQHEETGKNLDSKM